MNYTLGIRVLPRKGLANPQNETVAATLKKMGLDAFQSVSIGRWMEVRVNAASEDEAKKLTRAACDKLLVNPIMEDIEIEVLRK